jgi:hypothetical protein
MTGDAAAAAYRRKDLFFPPIIIREYFLYGANIRRRQVGEEAASNLTSRCLMACYIQFTVNNNTRRC